MLLIGAKVSGRLESFLSHEVKRSDKALDVASLSYRAANARVSSTRLNKVTCN